MREHGENKMMDLTVNEVHRVCYFFCERKQEHIDGNKKPCNPKCPIARKEKEYAKKGY